ncbi:MAG: dTDP-4-dehydrorhamnose 3,5-epimerase [Eggerthellaceae bacterium]|nr:dTDP-4-dehydrorhamnose 3,5-epimerase [Eggerthellaceae bacterium]
MVFGNFCFSDTSIAGLRVIDVKRFGDERGYFLESYKRSDFAAAGIDTEFVQDNQSFSRKGVLRGLHYQLTKPQAKLVRVVSGEVFDVAVDLRKGSESFGEWEGVVLSDANCRQFFIPRGFAHGFLVLSDTAILSYKCDELYHPKDEAGLMWNDPDVGIVWPDIDCDLIISEKDLANPPLISC